MSVKIKLIFVILTLIFLINVFVAYKVIKYYEGFSNDPLIYAAKTYDINYCYCINNNGKSFSFNQSNIWSSIQINSGFNSSVNYTEILGGLLDG